RLEAGSRIVPHTAPTDVRLKAHLGLQVPSGAALDVAGETRPWRDGEVFVFDDSFWHQAWNNHSSEPRLIL
ncbi:Arginine/Asparagine/Proline hydroxylase, partial [Pelagophyceae sp. CCMP2097]